MKLNTYLIPLTKINSKWIKDLDRKLEILKLIGKKIGKKFLDIVLTMIFF